MKENSPTHPFDGSEPSDSSDAFNGGSTFFDVVPLLPRADVVYSSRAYKPYTVLLTSTRVGFVMFQKLSAIIFGVTAKFLFIDSIPLRGTHFINLFLYSGFSPQLVCTRFNNNRDEDLYIRRQPYIHDSV